MKRFIIYFILLGVIFFTGLVLFAKKEPVEEPKTEVIRNESAQNVNKKDLHPMSIESLREREYEGGQFQIEQTLQEIENYRQYIASYRSEGLKIFGLLTVPKLPKPPEGFPAIIFVHGYIDPRVYSTINNYAGYHATLANAGFVTFKPDLRGHGNSEGEPVSAHFSEKYVVDTLSAIAYLKQHPDVNPDKIGYWGHSNGGEIGLRALVVSADIKAAALWAGVVGSFEDMLETHNAKIPFLRDAKDQLITQYGNPSTNKEFWDQIDPYAHLEYINAPIQIHHATGDKSVPIELSEHLNEELKRHDKSVEFFVYPDDDHNIGNNSGTAWRRTIEFYKKVLN